MMIPQLDILTPQQKELVLKAPVLISVLESCSDNNINKAQKADAIRLVHWKTYTSVPLLFSYYREVEKDFAKKFEKIILTVAPFDNIKKSRLKQELGRALNLINKLDKDYGDALLKSLQGYEKHVRKSGQSIFQDIIFPFAYNKAYD